MPPSLGSASFALMNSNRVLSPALGIALNGTLGLARGLGCVGGERGRQVGACVALSGVAGMSPSYMRSRLRMQFEVNGFAPRGPPNPAWSPD